MKELFINGNSLTLEQIEDVALKNTKVSLKPDTISKIKKSREVVEKLASLGLLEYTYLLEKYPDRISTINLLLSKLNTIAGTPTETAPGWKTIIFSTFLRQKIGPKKDAEQT